VILASATLPNKKQKIFLIAFLKITLQFLRRQLKTLGTRRLSLLCPLKSVILASATLPNKKQKIFLIAFLKITLQFLRRQLKKYSYIS